MIKGLLSCTVNSGLSAIKTYRSDPNSSLPVEPLLGWTKRYLKSGATIGERQVDFLIAASEALNDDVG